VLLRAEKAAYEVGETLRLQAFTTAAVDALYLECSTRSRRSPSSPRP
jgi:hypothetical protein